MSGYTAHSSVQLSNATLPVDPMQQRNCNIPVHIWNSRGVTESKWYWYRFELPNKKSGPLPIEPSMEAFILRVFKPLMSMGLLLHPWPNAAEWLYHNTPVLLRNSRCNWVSSAGRLEIPNKKSDPLPIVPSVEGSNLGSNLRVFKPLRSLVHGLASPPSPHHTLVLFVSSLPGFFSWGTGRSPYPAKILPIPPSDTCPRFWTKACPPSRGSSPKNLTNLNTFLCQIWLLLSWLLLSSTVP